MCARPLQDNSACWPRWVRHEHYCKINLKWTWFLQAFCIKHACNFNKACAVSHYISVVCKEALSSTFKYAHAPSNLMPIRFDFVTVPLFHPRYKREYFLPGYTRPGPATRSDKVINSSDWSTLAVTKLSPWIQLDSKDETQRRLSEKVNVLLACSCYNINVPCLKRAVQRDFTVISAFDWSVVKGV